MKHWTNARGFSIAPVAKNLLLVGFMTRAEALQAASLAALADLFAVVVPTVGDIPD
jgi:hypothetical protein